MGTAEMSQTIRRRRKSLGHSLRKIAELADQNWKTIQNLEHASHSPRLDTLVAVVESLGGEVSIVWPD